MKPRLFWTMLLAFVLVIGLSVCGMLGFFALSIAGFWPPGSVRQLPVNIRAPSDSMQRFWARLLAEQYVANGNSWTNVERRLNEPLFAGIASTPGSDYALAGADGRVVASNDRDWPVGLPLDPDLLARGAPVEVHGDRVGTFVFLSSTTSGPLPPVPPAPYRPVDFVWPILRGFVIAGLALIGVMLLLAIVFAQRISRPLRRLTAAAQALADGQRDVHVRGAPMRELDDLARAFNAMASALAQADEQRRQMTADIAHELRTPLTIIKGRLEGLQDGVYSATPDQIERLLNETALLERLIEDLRVLALAEAGQLPLYPEPLDPLDLLEDAASAFAGQAAAQGVTLRVEAPHDLPAIKADPLRMAQVLANLLTNALRYTPTSGSVTLRAELAPPLERKHLASRVRRTARELALEAGRGPAHPQPAGGDRRPLDGRSSDNGEPLPEGSRLIISVSDTGQGIAAEDLPHIFERFWRADRSRARGSGGAGLGLAIIRQIVMAHDGSIWAESAPGQGTTISLALPIPAEDDQAAGDLPGQDDGD